MEKKKEKESIMAMDIANLNNYGYSIDRSVLADNVKLILNNAAQKTAQVEQTIENKMQNSNAALLFEYTQNIAKSNVAQQFILDANLKETLKFLSSEEAKRMSKKSTKNKKNIVEQILTENDVTDFESNNREKSRDEYDLEIFDIKIDDSKKNIFAA